jgi:NAD(P)-dependent dehydrogenase (short-subunit alcohol dehydrogenase family)
MTWSLEPTLLVRTTTRAYIHTCIDFRLGHFYFTKLLIPLLKEGAKTSSDGKARIVTTSSITHVFVNKLNFATFKDSPERRRKFKKLLYPQSKYVRIVQAPFESVDLRV